VRNIKEMPRRTRVVIPDCPHHVTRRGNRRQNVFSSDSDRTVHTSLLRKYFGLSHLQLAGYTLMTNHVHTFHTRIRQLPGQGIPSPSSGFLLMAEPLLLLPSR
jgi:REP element-mobilizing transposase RayT